VLEDLQSDPAEPHLRLRALSARLSHLHSASVTRSFRIVLEIDNVSRTLTLLEIGTHDEV
jgi:mRNA-degrading endonuclease YafQ of YafQ-DinJ toxin-antitoxin module